MSLPTVPRDLVPVASSLSAFVHFPLPKGSSYAGQPVDKVAWSADYYDGKVTLRASLSRRGVQVAYNVDPVWVPRPPASWLALVAEMAGAVGLDSDEPLPVVAEAIAQAEGDHQIAELARVWHALHLQYRAETEGPEGHLKAATWVRLNRALVALVKALDAEARS